jgi:hypothetical protein
MLWGAGATHWSARGSAARVLLLLTASIAASSGTLLASGAVAYGATTGSISGTATDASGTPITSSDVCVTATDFANDDRSANATTDGSGHYAIVDLPPGSYEVYFADCESSARNDVPRYYRSATSEYEVELAQGEARAGVDARLAAGTTISGHVYGGAGTATPLLGACVTAHATDLGASGAAKTTAGGAYVMSHVDPSRDYNILFEPCTDASPYVPSWYDGARQESDATVVTSSIAAPSTGIDAHLDVGGTVAGTVSDADGAPITSSDICISAYGSHGGTGGSGYATSDALGHYAVNGLAADMYTLHYNDCDGSVRDDLSGVYGATSTSPYGSTVVVTLAHVTSGIDINLASATSVSGHAYGAAGTGTPLADVCVDVYQHGGDDFYGFARTDAAGAYTVAHLQPDIAYTVRFLPCAGQSPYVGAYYDGRQTVGDADPVTPTVTHPATGIDGHLPLGGSITGTIRDASGAPITSQDICVAAYGDQSFGSAKTDASGRYAIVGLAGGSLTVFARDCDDARNDLPQYYGQVASASGATPVSVTLGQATSAIDVRLPAATSVAGHVYGGSGTSTPLRNVCVEVIATETGNYGGQASTDVTGAYRAVHLQPGEGYKVRFEPCGNAAYTGEYYDRRQSLATASTLAPTVANPSTGIDAHLSRSATISGTVTDSGAAAITSEDICVSADSGNDYGSATTDDAGHYAIVGLDAGSYHVQFADCNQSRRNDVEQYFGGARTPETSTLVVLSTGGNRTGVDARMVAGTTITGTAYAGSGTASPLVGGCATLVPVDSGSDGALDATDQQGKYRFSHLDPLAAGYKVRIGDCNAQTHVTTYYGGDYRYSSGTVLKPTAAASATGIDVHLPDGGTVTGVVSDSHGSVSGGICVYAYLGVGNDFYHAYGSVENGTSGAYSVGGLPDGSYRLQFYDCDDVRNDLVLYRPALVSVTQGATTSAINATMSPATSISGRVYGGLGAATPLVDVCVEAFDAFNQFYEQDTTTKSDGSYSLKHLIPGASHKVQFNTCDDGGSGYGSQYFDGVSDFAQAAAVTATLATPGEGIDAHLPAAAAAPHTTITGGPAAGAATNQTTAAFAFTADQASAIFECARDGGAYQPCTSPFDTGTLATGSHSFAVRATTNGHVEPHPPFISWTVDPSSTTTTAQGTVTTGGTFSSAPGVTPSPDTPVVTSVTLPAAGAVTLTTGQATTGNGNGYSVFGKQIDIAADDPDGTGGVTGTTNDPIKLMFSLDASQIPPGTDHGMITVLRNGSPAANCASVDGTASPDPCVSNRVDLPGGDVEVDVLTTHCSTWNFAVTPAPVAAPVATGAPSISGNPSLGSLLTATNGTWTGASLSYAYQWLRDGATIAGATSATHVVVEPDLGHALAVHVTASNAAGNATAVSAAVQVPSPPSTGPEAGAVNPGTSTPLVTVTPLVGKSITPTSVPLTVTLASPGKPKLGAVRKKGLSLKLSCSSPCSVLAQIVVTGAIARKLKLVKKARTTTLGSARAMLSKTAMPIVVRLGANAKRALAHTHSVRVTVVVVATSAGKSVTTKRTLTLTG